MTRCDGRLVTVVKAMMRAMPWAKPQPSDARAASLANPWPQDARRNRQPASMLPAGTASNVTGSKPLALRNAEAAMAGIDKASPDYLRAQDIALATRGEMENARKGKKGGKDDTPAGKEGKP